MKQPFSKPALTCEQQLDQLVRRGLACADRSQALHYLTHINYYRLAAYWRPFERDHVAHVFNSDAHFDDVLNLYVFDRELRLLVLDAIERVEVSVRTGWSYTLAHRYGAHAHLNEALFKKPGQKWNYREQRQKLVDETRKSHESFVKHMRENYSEPLPPIWAIAEVMTLGQLSKWYGNLKSGADRNAVARRYDLDETNLTSFLHHLSTVRNLCAHHGRLWNREFIFAFSLPRRRPEPLAASLNRNSKRIYNTLAVLAWLMDCINPRHHWKRRVKEILTSHAADMRAMGFPENWEERPVWLDKRTLGNR